jgi:hypothetical protein
MGNDNGFDFGRAAQLLGVVQQIAGVAPSMTAISSEAMAELKLMNDDLVEARSRPRQTMVPPARPTVENPQPSKPVDQPQPIKKARDDRGEGDAGNASTQTGRRV